MATLKAKRLQEALQKARNVGRVEEALTIGDCSIVLQNLAPEDYNIIVQEIEELDGAEYLHAHQIAHISRSVVEIEGVDLRDIQFIEEDVPSGEYALYASTGNEAKANKAIEVLAELGIKLTVEPPEEGGEVKTIKLEKSDWIRQRVNTWGREAVMVAYRKFAELVVKAEIKAKENVQFQVPDENAEEKFRRLLTEAKELESDLPDDLIKKILADAGYMPASTKEEIEQIGENARQFREEQAAMVAQARVEAEVEEVASIEPLAALPQRLQPDPEAASRAAVAARQLAQDLMKTRQPLNQIPMSAPVPGNPPIPAGVPSQIRNADRATDIANLEAQLDPSLMGEVQQQQANQVIKSVAELNRQQQVDGKGVKSILNQPPAIGLNPKYRPIQKT